MKISTHYFFSLKFYQNEAKITNQPNVKIRSFPAPVMAEIKSVTAELLKEAADKDPKTKEILESIYKYQDQIRAWTNFSDKAYLDSFEEK